MAASQSVAPVAPLWAKLPGRRKRVLLAEDDADFRALLVHVLERNDWDVDAAYDGSTMLGLLSSVARRELPRPDAIVMDVRMPGHSGLELLHALRCAEWDTPVILITSFGDHATHLLAADMGAVMVLDKPFDVNDLCAGLDQLGKATSWSTSR